VDCGPAVKLALPGKVTRRAYKVFVIYDRVLTNALSDFEFDNPHLKLFYNRNKKSYLIIVQIHKKKGSILFWGKNNSTIHKTTTREQSLTLIVLQNKNVM
jgi:hypothetical protein